MTPEMSEDPRPCETCGGMAYHTSDIHAGVWICQSCEKVLSRSWRISHADSEYSRSMMGGKGIYFNVRPEWGGGERVYLLVGPDEHGWHGRKSGPVWRYQKRGSTRESLHQIVRNEPFSEVPLDEERYREIMALADGVRVPLVAGGHSGNDGTDLALMIRSGSTVVECRWWAHLPKEWETELGPFVAALWELVAKTDESRKWNSTLPLE